MIFIELIRRDYMTRKEIYDLIKRRRFQIWVNSYIYYRLNDNLVSNQTFDNCSDELRELQAKYPDISQEVELYEIFKDYEMSSDSAALPFDNNPGLHSRAVHLLRYVNSKEY